MSEFDVFLNAENGNIRGDIIDYTYGQLEKYLNIVEEETAIDVLNNLFKYNINNLKLKAEPIKVAFIVYSSSEWQCEGLYRLMEKDENFNPTIVLCGYVHGTESGIEQTYVDVCEYFDNRQEEYDINYMGFKDEDNSRDNLEGFDILIYLNAGKDVFVPKNINLSYQFLSKLIIHIPYSYYLALPYFDKYNSPVFMMCWKYYAANELEKKFVSAKQRLRGYNITASGMSKLDDYIFGKINVRKNIWKGEGKLKIIWAPHWNCKMGMNGTFAENYMFFLQYAMDNREISWIVRPHPRLMIGTIENGIFENEKEYKEYFEKWNVLPNANVISNGDYYDVFESSDAMIHDSISFLAEYMYSFHPQLWLTQDKRRTMNELGEKIIKEIDVARGNDYNAIECFIKKIVLWNDHDRKMRKEFIEEYLMGVVGRKGIRSSKYILNDIRKEIFG